MRLLISNHSIGHFLVCLKSVKLPPQVGCHLQTISTIKLPSTHIKTLQMILNLKRQNSKGRYRLKYILKDSYHSICRKVKNKCVQRFVYNYVKSYKIILKNTIDKKQIGLWSLKLQALTSLYVTYKILQSKNPAYSYFLLITNN